MVIQPYASALLEHKVPEFLPGRRVAHRLDSRNVTDAGANAGMLVGNTFPEMWREVECHSEPTTSLIFTSVNLRFQEQRECHWFIDFPGVDFDRIAALGHVVHLHIAE